MPLAQMQALQFNLHPTTNTLLLSHYGYNGTGTQPDWSGNGHNGTVTGATVADHVPMPPAFPYGDDDVTELIAAQAFTRMLLLGVGV